MLKEKLGFFGSKHEYENDECDEIKNYIVRDYDFKDSPELIKYCRKTIES